MLKFLVITSKKETPDSLDIHVFGADQGVFSADDIKKRGLIDESTTNLEDIHEISNLTTAKLAAGQLVKKYANHRTLEEIKAELRVLIENFKKG